jgi:hypothetical protein
MPGTYSPAHKKYYEAHRDEIREQRKAADKAYYERNKERIKSRVLQKYYEKKGIPNIQTIYLEIAPDLPAEESPASELHASASEAPAPGPVAPV